MSPENLKKLTLLISRIYNNERKVGEMSDTGPFRYYCSVQLVGV